MAMMRISSHRAERIGRSAGVAAVLACLALLPGCAPSEPEGPTAIDPSEAQGIQPPPGAELTVHQCLVGGWSLQGDDLAAYLDSFEPGEDIVVTGQVSLGFTLDRYLVAPRVGVTWENRGTETLASLVGDAVGAYVLQESALEVEPQSDDIEFVTVSGSQRSDVASLFFSPVTSNPLTGATAQCAQDVLTITSSADSDGLTVSMNFIRTR